MTDDMGHLLIKIILNSRGQEWWSGGDDDDVSAGHAIRAGCEFVHGLGVVDPSYIEGADAWVVTDETGRFNAHIY
eukprot:scaffold45582_cov63-Attheya_sp.AAC.1